MNPRELYIDRLRTVLTALVIFHHCSITYGASGGWFYYERKFDGSPVSMLLTLFTGTQQAYFMGFFFLLAGYFTASSFDRKGTGGFLRDRFRRLGWPLLAFGFFLGPLTAAIVEKATGGSFWGTFAWLWQHKRFINGPLWFAQALLIFSLVYCLWRAWARRWDSLRSRKPAPVPSFYWWLGSALAVGAVSLAIRQYVPVGENVFGLQLGFFASYIFLFFLGIRARRKDWLAQLTWSHAWKPCILSLLVWPTLWIIVFLHALHHPQSKLEVSGGTSFPAIVYAFWEPLFAWGVIAALLLLFRRWLNSPSPLWDWLGRRAYAVYVIHPLVLVSAALLLHSWQAPVLVKFGVVGALSCLVCWLLSDPLVRLPGVRKIF
jgi:peptidoglycan/LPS O-acetylase OafA/YrhL